MINYRSIGCRSLLFINRIKPPINNNAQPVKGISIETIPINLYFVIIFSTVKEEIIKPATTKNIPIGFIIIMLLISLDRNQFPRHNILNFDYLFLALKKWAYTKISITFRFHCHLSVYNYFAFV